MTRTRKLMGIAVVALVVGGSLAVAGHAAKSPIATTGTKIADGSKHACVEGTFEWRWNIPYASTCDAQPD
jgi:hypothetical protein